MAGYEKRYRAQREALRSIKREGGLALQSRVLKKGCGETLPGPACPPRIRASLT